MHLFAQKGLDATTVGDIERAAGLSPRSGALYKYFDSKESLLAAGIQRHLDSVQSIENEIALQPLHDMRSEFTMLGRWLFHELEHERDLTHILEREGERLGPLRDRVRIELSDRSYRIGTDVVGRWRPDLGVDERKGLSAVAVGALINFKRSTWTFGTAPLALTEEQVIESWVDFCSRFITSR
jgi:AcrR family transcriptional regulator